jgi:hypothetical protein
MNKILNFIHTVITCMFTAITFILVDIPLKIILFTLFIVFGIIASLFYPLIRKFTFPRWVDILYDYTTERQLIAKKVFKLWR